MLQHLTTQNDDLRMIPTNRAELVAAVGELREELRGLPTDADHDRRRVINRWIGIGLLTLGDYPEALGHLNQALSLAVASGNGRAVIAAELNIGDAHRYAGATEEAEVLYRKALAAAREQHPELVDFALQHFGKHLMEEGNLQGARARLQEALALRQSKNDATLIESTQAALDRVDLLISRTGAGSPAAGEEASRRWSSEWTAWLRSRTFVDRPSQWGRDFPSLQEGVWALADHRRVLPRHLRDQPFPPELIAAMAEEAEQFLTDGRGYLHNGKWNAAVGEAASRFAAQMDLAAAVELTTGIAVEQPHTAVYLAYQEKGQKLDFHVDNPDFGVANVILCLRHTLPADAPRASTTVFITGGGYIQYSLRPGEYLVFDGVLAPHGRTPLCAGERVLLVSFGFHGRGASPRTAAELPSAPLQL
ncbi:tetratricopeptide repeat protein [Streptomyces sp. NPDC001493]